MEENTNSTVTSHRYTARGRRRGKHGYAAPLGMLITLLSLVGVAALVFGGIRLIKKAADTTALKEEMYYFLQPLMVYNPTPFENIAETEQDAFLSAAAYRVSQAEQIRMLRENDENCTYPVDDQGRIAVPVATIEESYNALFGPESPLIHHSLEDNGLVFSEPDDCYYVPFNSLVAGYRGVIDYVRHKGNTYTVRVGYVANNDVRLDEHGNEIPPTASMATYYQTYTLIKYADGYCVNGCADN